MIPFKIKKLTNTARLPHREDKGDLWDLFADEFYSIELNFSFNDSYELFPNRKILVKTGLAIELPKRYGTSGFHFESSKPLEKIIKEEFKITGYAVADIRPRSGLALKHGLTVLNTPGTIDNLYRQEIGVIMINHGHEPYTINKGDKIAQMLIRELAPSSFIVVEDFEDTGRGGFGSTGF
jgi:dUTPase